MKSAVIVSVATNQFWQTRITYRAPAWVQVFVIYLFRLSVTFIICFCCYQEAQEMIIFNIFLTIRPKILISKIKNALITLES